MEISDAVNLALATVKKRPPLWVAPDYLSVQSTLTAQVRYQHHCAADQLHARG